MILYIKNIDIEGPGTLGNFFDSKGIKSRTVDLGAGGRLPENLNDFKAVVVLGGPMNVYDEEEFPYLKMENELIKEVLKKEIPYLGLCLGSQLLAKAAGARVVKSPNKEIGFKEITLSPDGQMDPLFKGVKSSLDVFHWHEDMFEIPKDGVLLAGSAGCPHQAMKIGACAYGLQFHIEITDVSISQWSDKYICDHKENLQMKEEMLKEYFQKEKEFRQTALTMYNNFLRLIQ